MPPFDINQIQTVEEAALCFENAYCWLGILKRRCAMMGDYRSMKEAEQIIQVIATHHLAEQVFRTCLCNSSQSYCVFYVVVTEHSNLQSAKLFGILMMKKWSQLSAGEQNSVCEMLFSVISYSKLLLEYL